MPRPCCGFGNPKTLAAHGIKTKAIFPTPPDPKAVFPSSPRPPQDGFPLVLPPQGRVPQRPTTAPRPFSQHPGTPEPLSPGSPHPKTSFLSPPPLKGGGPLLPSPQAVVPQFRTVALQALAWVEAIGYLIGQNATSANTGLPASVALLLPPNPCPVTAFAEKQRRKCRAQGGGFGNPGALYESRQK